VSEDWAKAPTVRVKAEGGRLYECMAIYVNGGDVSVCVWREVILLAARAQPGCSDLGRALRGRFLRHRVSRRQSYLRMMLSGSVRQGPG
jgi:hypothetical protein